MNPYLPISQLQYLLLTANVIYLYPHFLPMTSFRLFWS